jgi:hypothetical protein
MVSDAFLPPGGVYEYEPYSDLTEDDHLNAICRNWDTDEINGFPVLWTLLIHAAKKLGATQGEIDDLPFEDVIDDLNEAYGESLRRIFEGTRFEPMLGDRYLN